MSHPQRVVVMDERLDAVKADRETIPGSGLEDWPVLLISNRRIDANVGDAHAHDIGMSGVAVDLLGGMEGVLRRHNDCDLDAVQILVGVHHVLVVSCGERRRPLRFG